MDIKLNNIIALSTDCYTLIGIKADSNKKSSKEIGRFDYSIWRNRRKKEESERNLFKVLLYYFIM